jgi:hypothetical protein
MLAASFACHWRIAWGSVRRQLPDSATHRQCRAGWA